VVRIFDNKAKKPAWSTPIVVMPAFEDDAPAVAAGDTDGAWLAVSSKSGLGLRVAHVDGTGKLMNVVPRDDGKPGAPAKLGRIATFVPLKGHVAVIGRDGDAITFARLMRNGTFFDTTAKQIAKGSASMSTTESRSPRAVAEDDKVLLAWDGDDVAGALDTPGTTPAEKLAPKSGIYVRRLAPTVSRRRPRGG